MLVDTDVLIWVLRGSTRAARAVERIEHVALSAVTYIELVQGTRSKEELRILRAALAEWKPRIIPIDEAVSMRACLYVERYAHSHGIRLADALVAATAAEKGLPLLTANDKHYRMISELTLRVFRPK
jgi:predicted nucleic acid-binding protein